MQTQALHQNQAAPLDNQVQASKNHHGFRLQNCLPSESGAGPGAPCGEHAPVRRCSASHPPPFLRVAGDSSFTVVLPVKHQNYVEGLCPTAGRPALTLFDSVGVGRV